MNDTEENVSKSNDIKALGKIRNLISMKIARSIVLFAFSLMLIFKWQTAILLTLFLLMHESGHILAMLRLGIGVSKLTFIPFLGALVKPDKDFFEFRKDEVKVVLMGPAVGLLFILATLIAWTMTGNIFFILVSVIMNIVNIFNLLPAGLLDGGRAFRSIIVSMFNNKDKGWICYTITAAIASISVANGLYVITMIMVLMAFQLKGLDLAEKDQKIKNMTALETSASILAYVAILLASLWLLSYAMATMGDKEALSALFAKWF